MEFDDNEFRGRSVFNVDPEQARTLEPVAVKVIPWMLPGGPVSFSPTRFPRSIAEARGV